MDIAIKQLWYMLMGTVLVIGWLGLSAAIAATIIIFKRKIFG